MPSIENFYLRHMALVVGCSKEEAVGLLGFDRFFGLVMDHQINIKGSKCYWRRQNSYERL